MATPAELRAELAAAKQARAAGDHAQAHERIAAAIERALPALAVHQEPEHLCLCALGHFAREIGELRLAERFRRAVLEMSERTLPEGHPELLRVRGHLAISMLDLGDLHGARALQEAVLEASLRTLPEDHPHLLSAQQNLAGTLMDLGDLRRARALFEAVLEARERTLPENHTEILDARQDLAGTSAALGDLAGARALFGSVLEVRERTLPEDHPALLAARSNLAATMYSLGDLHGARALQEAVLETRERTLPEDHADLLTTRVNLALTLGRLGDLDRARALQEAVLLVLERTLPEDHPDLLATRTSLASTVSRLGGHHRAHALLGAVLEAFERTLPEDHPQVLAARQGMVLTMGQLGDLHGARALQEAVLEALERTMPEDHHDLLFARRTLAEVMRVLGDLAGARALEEAVLEALGRTRPEDLPSLLRARASLAETMQLLGDLHGARALQEAVLEAVERTLPDAHPDRLNARHSLAGTIAQLGDFAGARTHFAAVLETFARTLPEDHPHLLAARGNLAWTMNELGDFAGARALAEAVLAARERTLPTDHPDLSAARLNLAWTLARAEASQREESKGDGVEGWPRALALVGEAAREQTRALRGVLLGAPAREAEERTARGSEWPLENALGFAAGLGILEPEEALYGEAFVLSESGRGAGILSATVARSAVAEDGAARLRAEIRAAGAELADLARRGAAREEYHRARVRREAAERELLGLARESLGERSAILDVTAEGLGRALEEGQALVGYRRYTKRWFEIEEGARADGEARLHGRSRDSLGAFVLARSENEEEPRLAFVDLGPFDAVERAVHGWRAAIGVGQMEELRSGPGEAHGGRGIGLDSLAPGTGSEASAALRRLVWDPLLEALAGAERIVVALDDLLHLVPVDALELEEGAGLVGERWRIGTRVALWELLDVPPPIPGGGVLVSLGGASFGSTPIGLAAADLPALEPGETEWAPAAGQPIALLRGGAWERGFAPLPYTRKEAQGLAGLFNEVFDDRGSALVLDGRRASRLALEEASSRARWLHVATHGWFAPESVRSWADVEPRADTEGLGLRIEAEETVRDMSPMLLCGLALAGANLAPDSRGRVPGLVTAEELSTLDLTGCELAVLSACDTNVGERRAGQGVASLQKALHMAGARSVITSLWKVPDEATSELMLDFYRRLWVEQKPKHQALWEAKKRLRDARDERGQPLYTTRDWAAWVLTGDPN